MERGFVLTDAYCRTNVPGVWAVGDIVPGVQLAHRGFAQGIQVAETIAGLEARPVDDNLVPKVTFCEPEIASVGLSEAKAKDKYGADAVVTSEFNVAGNAKSQILGTQGFVKLVALKDGPIVGFHAIGARMGEQVGEGQLMVTWEAYADDVAALVIQAHGCWHLRRYLCAVVLPVPPCCTGSYVRLTAWWEPTKVKSTALTVPTRQPAESAQPARRRRGRHSL